MHAGISGR